MNFEEFKKRYAEKTERMGATQTPDDDMLAELYLGLVIFSEWQADEINKANSMQKKRTPENKIYVPNKGIIH